MFTFSLIAFSLRNIFSLNIYGFVVHYCRRHNFALNMLQFTARISCNRMNVKYSQLNRISSEWHFGSGERSKNRPSINRRGYRTTCAPIFNYFLPQYCFECANELNAFCSVHVEIEQFRTENTPKLSTGRAMFAESARQWGRQKFFYDKWSVY